MQKSVIGDLLPLAPMNQGFHPKVASLQMPDHQIKRVFSQTEQDTVENGDNCS
jgi:hypothetical protein